MALAAYAGRLFFCGGAEPVVRLSALRLPSFKGGTWKGFLEA